MKLTDILTQAQMLAGIGDFTGNSIDQNAMATSLAIFHQTLNNINNDPKITLWQNKWDYQRDNDQVPAAGNNPPIAPGSWLNPFPPEDATPAPDNSQSKFPDYKLPFKAAMSYPFPNDCRRVVKCVSNQTVLRKVDYSEVVSSRRVSNLQSVYAINNRMIELVNPQPALIIYAIEFPTFKPQDDVTLPPESLSYVIAYTAYNIALTFNTGNVDKCQIMMQQGYEILISNLTVNAGYAYLDPLLAINRFTEW